MKTGKGRWIYNPSTGVVHDGDSLKERCNVDDQKRRVRIESLFSLAKQEGKPARSCKWCMT